MLYAGTGTGRWVETRWSCSCPASGLITGQLDIIQVSTIDVWILVSIEWDDKKKAHHLFQRLCLIHNAIIYFLWDTWILVIKGNLGKRKKEKDITLRTTCLKHRAWPLVFDNTKKPEDFVWWRVTFFINCSGVREYWSFGGTEKQRKQRKQRNRVNQSLLEVGNGVEVHTVEDGQGLGFGLGVPWQVLGQIGSSKL